MLEILHVYPVLLNIIIIIFYRILLHKSTRMIWTQVMTLVHANENQCIYNIGLKLSR